MVVGRVIGSVLFSAMAAYACARLSFPGKYPFQLSTYSNDDSRFHFITPQYLLAQNWVF